MDQAWSLIDIDRFAEPSGTLSVLEHAKHIPFAVRRVFWLTDIPGPDVERGAHAHAELQQVLFCANGACDIALESRQGDRETIRLSRQGPALFLDGPVWRTMRNFTPDCSLIVLCDREYASDRVVRDYQEFLAL